MEQLAQDIYDTITPLDNNGLTSSF